MKTAIATLCGAAVLAVGVISNPIASKGTPAPNVDKGKETFEQCAVCHNVDTDEKKMGPSLKGLFQKEKLKNGKKPTEANIKAIINAGGNGMPAYADMLADDEKTDLIAYLKTI